jgi:uncharacterized protein
MNISEPIPERIIHFIKEHHVLSISTAHLKIPWIANCFYVWIESENAFVFTSDDNTRHILDAMHSGLIAGTVVLETSNIGKIRGLQFQAILSKAENDMFKICRKAYIGKFPYAVLSKTDLWIARPFHLKMTDNRMGFGKKLYWGESK